MYPLAVQGDRSSLLPRALSLLIGCALTPMLLASCDSTESTEPAVPTTLVLEPASAELAWGRDSVWISAELLDQHGRTLEGWPPDHGLSWVIGDTSIAKMVDDGITALIRSASTGGQTTLIGTAGALASAQADITVLPPPDSISGGLSFQYSGDHSGSFVVDGAWPFDHHDPGLIFWRPYLLDQRAWVASFYSSEDDRQYIFAHRVRPDGREDLFGMHTDGRITGPGTYELSGSTFEIGRWYISGRLNYEATYDHFSHGSVTVTSAEPERLVGTFEVELGDRSENPWWVLQIGQGRFDAALIMDQPWP